MKRTIMAAAAVMLSFTASAALADSLTTGVVNANGTIQGGGPFTVSHPSAGRYIITFTSFTGVPLCLFNTIGSATNISSLGVSTKTCDVTFIGKKKKPTDALFVFFAI